jgi:menaquinone-9 beta-reductase
MMASLHYDAIIAGGGPSGASLAIRLARSGRRVILVERCREAQHKVCGEFMSPETAPILADLGIDLEELGARRIRRVRLAARDVFAESELPSPAFSLTRKALDEALLRRAQSVGVSLMRGYSVESLEHPADGWQASVVASMTQERLSVHADEAFLATGKHDLRAWQRASDGAQNGLVAMKMYFALPARQQAQLEDNVELILYPGGYAGLQLVEGGCANLCTLTTRERLRTLGNRWQPLLEHMVQNSRHLALRLAGARPLEARPFALSSIPYGYTVEDAGNAPVPWRLGDQAAVIPSFCGGGVAIALHTARMAAEMYLAGARPRGYHAEVRQQFQQRLYYATLLSRLMIALPGMVQAVRLYPELISSIFSATRVPGSAIHAVAQ